MAPNRVLLLLHIAVPPGVVVISPRGRTAPPEFAPTAMFRPTDDLHAHARTPMPATDSPLPSRVSSPSAGLSASSQLVEADRGLKLTRQRHVRQRLLPAIRGRM